MKRRCSTARNQLSLLALLVLAGAIEVRGEGPLYVGGPVLPLASANPGAPSAPGKPFIWTINPLTYWTDRGSLGTLTTSSADSLVQQSFQVWQATPTATLSFSRAGQLPIDVSGSNVMLVLNQLDNCSVALTTTSLARDRTIIYDTDGSAISALGGDPTMILGEASPLCSASDGTTNSYQRGFAILNGLPLKSGATTLDLKSTMIHEFGHLIGLDHSQINLNCLTAFCGPDDMAGIPIMFPVAINPTRITLSTDDVAAISVLYPVPDSAPPGKTPFSSLGRIQGHVFFTDGETPAQGFNVIARQVDNPSTPQNESRRIAVSNVSGFLFTACVTNPVLGSPLNDCGPYITPFGSRDQTLIGFYDVPGLPVGSGQQYTVEVEAIHNSDPIPFVYGSSVGPIGVIGFQFPLPMTPGFSPPCSPEYLSSPTASCTDKTQLQPSAGQILNTGTDVILINTPPRYDAWEDGP